MKKDLVRLTLIVAVAFIALVVGTAIYFSQNVDSAKEMMAQFMDSTKEIVNDDGTLSYVGIVSNNLFACAISVGMGVVPLLFLPVISILANSSVVGAVLGLGQGTGTFSAAKMVVFGLLPHGIFELPAIFLSMAMGIYLCRTLTMKILGKAKDEKLIDVLNGIAKTFVLVIIPLVIVAAVVECMITPSLLAYVR